MKNIFNDQNIIDNNSILILDFDGVFFAPEYIQIPKKEAINELNRIIKETNCKLVISSSHKIKYNYDHSMMNHKLKEWGLIDSVIAGFTYGSLNCCDRFNGRENEILHWLSIHKPIRYCALDDSIREKSNWVRCIHALGVTKHDADRVISWLNFGKLSNELDNIKVTEVELGLIEKFYGKNYSKYIDISKLIITESNEQLYKNNPITE